MPYGVYKISRTLSRRIVGVMLFGFIASMVITPISVLSDPSFSPQSDSPCATNGGSTLTALEPGTLLEREIIGNQAHCYKFDLRTGDYIHIVAEQKGSDIILTIFAPDGSKRLHIDRPNGSRGAEGLSFIANLTGTFYMKVSGYSESATRGTYQIKIDALRKAIPQDESRMLAERLTTEGEEYRFEGTVESLPKAVEKFKGALNLWRAFNDTYEQAVALYGLGWTYSLMGENQLAINHFNQSMTLMREVNNPYGMAAAQTGLAWEYLYFGETGKALLNFLQTLDVKRSLNDKRGEAISLYGIGWCYSLQDVPEKALNYFFQSLQLRQDINDTRGEALTHTGIGNAYARQGKRREALNSLNNALQYFRSLKGKKDFSGEANVLSSLGWNYLALKEYQSALNRFAEALEFRRKGGDRLGEATTLFGIAKVEREQGDLLDAHRQMELSLELIEAMLSKGTNNQLRLSYFASVQEYYEFSIDLLMQLHRIYPTKGYEAAALSVSERARARSLIDLLAESNVDIKQGVSQDLIEHERHLRQQLSDLAYHTHSLGSVSRSTEKSEALSPEIERLSLQHEEVLSQIREASPLYAVTAQLQKYTVSELQKEIAEDTLVLEYTLGEDRSYLFSVSAKEIMAFELPPRVKLEEEVRKVYKLLTARIQEPQEVKNNKEQLNAEYAEAVWNLSQTLLGQVKSLSKVKRLVVASQGILQLIPFAVLPTPIAISANHKLTDAKNAQVLSKLPPLVVTHEVVTIPSISTLALLHKVLAGRKTASKILAIFADPVFNKEDERVRHNQASPRMTPGGTPADEMTLERLSATRWEAEQIKLLVGESDSLLALDFAANRHLAMSDEISRYRILHFATHALINDEYPQLSEIALSAVNEQGEKQDGALRAYDLFNRKLSADLVVLSGCKTGLGKDIRGEGVMNLTRMFMCAGVPRVIVTLWAVDDKAAADLMVKFYKKMLVKKISPSTALRETQAEMWREGKWKSPFYWGAFQLQGDWN
jgi:CHAT domain-containing protein